MFNYCRLGKSVKDAAHTVSPAVVQSYILPIATHYLFDEDRLSKNFNDLIDSSIEVCVTQDQLSLVIIVGVS